MIDYSDLFGVQFAYGGRGPEKFDCYGLLIEMHRRIGKEIPDYRSPTDQAAIAELMGVESSKWACVAHTDDFQDRQFPPSIFRPGQTIIFQIGGFASHVGFVINRREFIHVWEGSGVVEVQPIHRNWKRRIIGVYEYDD